MNKKSKQKAKPIKKPTINVRSILKYKTIQVQEANEKKLKLLQNWLLSGRKITSRQCSRMWGYDRCADGIFKLRRVMKIQTTMVFGKDRFLRPVRYAEYKYMCQRPVIRQDDKQPLSGETTYTFKHRFVMKPAELKKHVTEYLEKQVGNTVKTLKMPTKKRNYVFVATDSGAVLIFNLVSK